MARYLRGKVSFTSWFLGSLFVWGLLSLLFCALRKAEPHRLNTKVGEDAYLLEFSRARLTIITRQAGDEVLARTQASILHSPSLVLTFTESMNNAPN